MPSGSVRRTAVTAQVIGRTINASVKTINVTASARVAGAPGNDGKDGLIQSVVAGANISVDSTDPANPIVSADGGGAVDSVNTQVGVVVLDQDDIGDGTTFKQYSSTEKTKLSGVATGATANSADATLLARANHTGVQAQSTVTSLVSDLALKAPLASPTFTGTVSGVTKAHVGLGSVDNTSNATERAAVATLTNKTISGASNTVSNISADATVDGTTNKAFLATERTKLTGIATAATANDTDANLKARANHTGTQTASTISDFSTAADARITAANKKTDSMTTGRLLGRGTAGTGAIEEIILGTNLSLSGTTLNAVGGGGGGGGDVFSSIATSTDNSVTRMDGTTGKLIQASPVIIDDLGAVTGVTTIDGRDPSVDGAKLDGIASAATANSADATLLARANHTGTQLAATISDFSTAADARVAAATATGTGSIVRATSPTIVTPTIASTGFTNAQHNHTGTTSGGQLTDAALSSAVTVSKGGTGRTTSTTAYGIIAAGTTATGAHQTLATGTSGQILKSNGTSALPTFQTGAKADVGLGNVDNTSDATKNTATATLSNKTLAAPKFASADYIADATGNELVKFPATVASAVNEVTISNAASLEMPTIEATGGDANISLNLVTKGAGIVAFNGTQAATVNTSQTFSNKSIDATANTVSNVSSLRVARQNITSNTTTNGVRIETGWSFTTSGAPKTMTFGTAFTAAPVVIASGIGYKDTTDPTTISDFSAWERPITNANSVSTTGFVVVHSKNDNTAVETGRRLGFSWIAIGV